MTEVSVPKNVWTSIVTASADTIVENLGHDEVFISTSPSYTNPEKLTITTITTGQTAYIYSVNKSTDVRYFVAAGGGHYQTLGPFTRANLPGTGTEALPLMFADSASTFVLSTLDPRAPRAGRVVGLTLLSNAARTAGTATARVRIAGSATDFDGGSVQINATNTQRASGLVAYASGVMFNAGNSLGIAVVTDGWTPTTADFVGWLTVEYEPF
jgi:hypothetical protein